MPANLSLKQPILLFFCAVTVQLLGVQLILCQGTKGGSVISQFQENINSIEQQQQQQLPTQQVREERESSFKQTQQQQQFQQIQQQQQFIQQQQQQTVDAEPGQIGSVRGVAGVDFPAHTSIPNTRFSCENVPYTPGMYADQATDCQVYHLCYEGRKESFLCGVGTVFNQAILNCDYWHGVECSKSAKYYHLNSDFGKASSESNSWNAGNSLVQSTIKQTQQQITSSVGKTNAFQQLVVQPRPVPLPQRVYSTQFQSNSERTVVSSNFGTKISPAFPTKSGKSSFSASVLSSGGGSVKGGGPGPQVVAPKRAPPNLLSPGQRIAAMMLAHNQAGEQMSAASESSNALLEQTANQTTTARSSLVVVVDQATKSAQTGEGLTTSKGAENSFKASEFDSRKTTQLVSGGGAPIKQGMASVQLQRQSKLAAIKSEASTADNADGWRPYFKTRTGANGATSSPASGQKQLQPTKSATTTVSLPEITRAQPSPAPGQPDQEPQFSAGQTSGGGGGEQMTTSKVPTGAIPEEKTEVPKSMAPPSAGREGSSKPLEPDVDRTLTTTTTGPPTSEFTPSSETPSTASEEPPPTSQAASTTETPNGGAVSENSSSDATSVTPSPSPTTPTTSLPPTSESGAGGEGEEVASQGEGNGGGGGGGGGGESNKKKRRTRRKKKRQGSGALTQSSVEYATATAGQV